MRVSIRYMMSSFQRTLVDHGRWHRALQEWPFYEESLNLAKKLSSYDTLAKVRSPTLLSSQ